jgi:superfamily II DNA/RNA helicase
VTQILVPVSDANKREALRKLIISEDVRNAIVFCNRKRDVSLLHKALERSGLHTLDDGERVEVELVQGKKGVEARRITPLGR